MPNLAFLIGSILALAVGPLLYKLARTSKPVISALDAFVFIGIGGLIAVHVIPETIEQNGWIALAIACLGLFGPLFLEHFVHHLAKEAHLIALVLGLSGLGIHAFADGIILSEPLSHSGTGGGLAALPFAVLVHRLPEGLTVWLLLRPLYGVRLALLALVCVAAATFLGFSLGSTLITDVTSVHSLGLFQALMAGALLHVVIHRPHPMLHTHERESWRVGPIIGTLLAAALLFLLNYDQSHRLDAHDSSAFLTRFMSLALESAPALILAYLLAGLVQTFLPTASVSWMKRGSSFAQALRGVSIGLPLPICSCGVLPVYRSLILQGAPASAAMAFLIATPELGFDAVLLSIPLLGIPFTMVRLAAAALVALAVGWFMGRWIATRPSSRLPAAVSTCPTSPSLTNPSVMSRLNSGLHVGLSEMVDHTGPWILVGLVIAALIDPFSEQSWLTQLPPYLDIPFFALLGIPAYVCASGATPLVAVLLAGGISPGAALAFLLTGPATNATTFGILSKLHGKKVAILFGGSIAILTIALGYGVNLMLPSGPALAIPELPHEAPAALWRIIFLVILCGLYALSLFRQGPRRFVGQVLPSASHGDE